MYSLSRIIDQQMELSGPHTCRTEKNLADLCGEMQPCMKATVTTVREQSFTLGGEPPLVPVPHPGASIRDKGGPLVSGQQPGLKGDL